ncbi:MAG TPA: SDR family NAD(P)-dependent oxidoreductase, partial [Polyangiaceae bacterium]|nr:SDR family NAD(P)-dependent oxidoreductase [Polyangiaceae bacterium]
MGAIHCGKAFIPGMVAAGRGGHVINVSSLAGYFALGQLASYSTSKFALMGFSEALRAELSPHDIHVSTVCPGVVDTPLTERMQARGVLEQSGKRRLINGIYRARGYSAERVATAIVGAVRSRQHLVFVTAEARAIHALKRLSPGLTLWLERTSTSVLNSKMATLAANGNRK